MTTGERVAIGVGLAALAGVLLWNIRGGGLIHTGAQGSGVPIDGSGSSPHAEVPPASTGEYIFASAAAPWGFVPPIAPFIRRSTGIEGVPQDVGGLSTCTGNCS